MLYAVYHRDEEYGSIQRALFSTEAKAKEYLGDAPENYYIAEVDPVDSKPPLKFVTAYNAGILYSGECRIHSYKRELESNELPKDGGWTSQLIYKVKDRERLTNYDFFRGVSYTCVEAAVSYALTELINCRSEHPELFTHLPEHYDYKPLANFRDFDKCVAELIRRADVSTDQYAMPIGGGGVAQRGAGFPMSGEVLIDVDEAKRNFELLRTGDIPLLPSLIDGPAETVMHNTVWKPGKVVTSVDSDDVTIFEFVNEANVTMYRGTLSDGVLTVRSCNGKLIDEAARVALCECTGLRVGRGEFGVIAFTTEFVGCEELRADEPTIVH